MRVEYFIQELIELVNSAEVELNEKLTNLDK